MGKIIAISNQKGGVGKTTTSVNLSACVAEAGKKTLLVDVDPQGNATSGLGVAVEDGARTIYEVLLGEAQARDACVDTGFDGLMLIPASIELAGAEVELVGLDGREGLLKTALAPLRDLFDYIFIDCPPSLGLLTLNALTAADSVLVPIQCEYYALVTEVRNHFPKEAFATLIPRNVRLSEAPSYGLPIHRYDARCNGAAAYRALAKELIGRNEGK